MPLPVWPFLLIVAPFVGSFIGVVVLRSGTGESSLLGRSRCDSCGHALAWNDLIPLVSWAMLAGHCRHCHGRVNTFYPLIEIAAAIPVLWASTVASGWQLVASSVLGWTLLALGLIDWRTQRLPDVLTGSLTSTGIIAAWCFDRGNILGHLIGAAAGFTVFALLAYLYRRVRAREGLGLGDAKLLAGLGAWVSWQGLPGTVLLGAATALVFVLVRAFWQHKLDLAQRIAFGPFLALAGWIIWLYGPLVPA